MDPTTKTYDEIAGDFARRNWNASLAKVLDKFSRHLKETALVLDLGCGPGRDIASLRDRGLQVVGMDLSTGMLNEAQERVGGPLACADMRQLPLPTSAFDGIWVCAALLHLPHEQAPGALAEMRRILRPGGSLYVSVKQGQGEQWNDQYGRRFFAYYGQEDLAKLVTGAGFAVEELWVEPQPGTTWISVIALAP
jgi:ubiquinone/menaquinone biosynthesis C-methylase UbiE